MPWELDSDRPIYTQIVDRLKHEIVSGFYPPGSRLPSVRDLAAQASVNPNTMQKAVSYTHLDVYKRQQLFYLICFKISRCKIKNIGNIRRFYAILWNEKSTNTNRRSFSCQF